MKKNTSALLMGIILILVALFIMAKAFGIITFSIFFDGWWTLFLIIPCGVALFNKDANRTACITGLIVGVFLLLCAQDVIGWNMMFPLGIAALLILVGVKLIFNLNEDNRIHHEHVSDNTNQANASQNTGNYNNYNTNYTYTNENGKVTVDVPYSESNADAQSNNSTSNTDESAATSNNNSSSNNSHSYERNYSYNESGFNKRPYACSAVFSGREINFDNEYFTGATLSAVFGAIELDLRHAKLAPRTIINCNSAFGGIDIAVPEYARVVVLGTPILGGVDCKAKAAPPNADDSTPIITINVSCILGGIDIK